MYVKYDSSVSDYSGIGYALAKEFLKAGDNVLICSRSGKVLLSGTIVLFKMLGIPNALRQMHCSLLT